MGWGWCRVKLAGPDGISLKLPRMAVQTDVEKYCPPPHQKNPPPAFDFSLLLFCPPCILHQPINKVFLPLILFWGKGIFPTAKYTLSHFPNCTANEMQINVQLSHFFLPTQSFAALHPIVCCCWLMPQLPEGMNSWWVELMSFYFLGVLFCTWNCTEGNTLI